MQLRPVGRFWTEKGLFLIDSLQMYALLWSVSQPWPWPAPWLKFTRWTVIANVDVHSLRERGAGMGSTGGEFSVWGEQDGYASYAAAWATLPHLLLAAESTHSWVLRRSSRSHLRHRVQASAYMLAWLQLLYVPSGLAVLRLLHCGELKEDNERAVEVDPHLVCGSASHMVVAGYGAGSFCLLTTALLGRLYSAIGASIVSGGQTTHERYLRRREFEYAASINNQWAEAQFWLHSSFQRHASYSRVVTLLTKLLLLLCLSLLKSHIVMQSLLFFFVVLVWAVFTWQRPYRCPSSNHVARIGSGLLLFDTGMGMLKGSGMRNSVTIANRHAIYLMFGNAIGFVLLALSIFKAFRHHQTHAFHAKARLRGDEKENTHENTLLLPMRTGRETVPIGRLRRINCHVCHSSSPWPMGVDEVGAMLRSTMVQRWVEALHMATDFRAQAFDSAASLFPLDTLDAHVAALVQHRTEARFASSLLEDTLDEMISELYTLRAEFAKTSLLPHSTLGLELPRAGPALERRHKRYSLLPEAKRQLLLRLLAVATFVGRRNIRRLPPEQIPWLSAQMQTQDAHAEESGLSRAQSLNMRMHQRNMQDQCSDDDDHSTLQTAQAPPSTPAGDQAPTPLPMPMPVFHDMKALEAATALLLSKPRSRARQEQLVFCQREWKLRLAEWETDFTVETGRQPTAQEKRVIRSWYLQYHAVRKAAETRL